MSTIPGSGHIGFSHGRIRRTLSLISVTLSCLPLWFSKELTSILQGWVWEEELTLQRELVNSGMCFCGMHLQRWQGWGCLSRKWWMGPGSSAMYPVSGFLPLYGSLGSLCKRKGHLWDKHLYYPFNPISGKEGAGDSMFLVRKKSSPQGLTFWHDQQDSQREYTEELKQSCFSRVLAFWPESSEPGNTY